jgi:hypothetical protein
MQDNPFYNYYAKELGKWEDFAETHQLQFKDREVSEYGLKFVLEGKMLALPFSFSCQIRYNNASNDIIPVRSRIFGSGEIALSDSDQPLFYIYNKPNYWKRRKAKRKNLVGKPMGTYTLFSKRSTQLTEAENKALSHYKVKKLEAEEDETEIKVFKYLYPEELKGLLELYTLLKEKAS